MFLLSYVDLFVREWLCEPKQGVLRSIIELLRSTHREKVIRICFRLFERVTMQGQHGVDLLIDLSLERAIENLTRGISKDE